MTINTLYRELYFGNRLPVLFQTEAYSQPTFKFYLSANKKKNCSWEKEVFCPLTHPTTTQSSLNL